MLAITETDVVPLPSLVWRTQVDSLKTEEIYEEEQLKLSVFEEAEARQKH